jgi:hypothetical protein
VRSVTEGAVVGFAAEAKRFRFAGFDIDHEGLILPSHVSLPHFLVSD